MTTAEKLYNVLANARTQQGGVLVKAKWIALADQFLDVERPVRPPPRKKVSAMTDAEWIAAIKQDPAMAGINVEHELGKCRFWCKNNGKGFTRRRAVNWLNKADRELERFGAGAAERRASLGERAEAPPHGWQEFMKTKQREWSEATRSDGDPPGTSALIKDDFFGMPKSWRDEARKALGGGP